MKRIFVFFAALVLAWGCASSSAVDPAVYVPEPTDYASCDAWYIAEKGAEVDVFYLLPTCIFDWTEDTSGLVAHHFDVEKGVQRANFDYSLDLAHDIFGDHCNFYAPLYRQISLDSWLEDEEVIGDRFAVAMDDVARAFAYYMEHSNAGRDFVLAGYSQGAKAVVELIKRLSGEQLSRMRAAYVVGYRITADDLASGKIRGAVSAEDRGVVVAYNSVHTPDDIWAAVAQDNEVCINPVSWSCDTLRAIIGDSISVCIDPRHKVLLVEGYDGGGAEIPLLKGTLTAGNYHLSELTLYKAQLEANVARRVGAAD